MTLVSMRTIVPGRIQGVGTASAYRRLTSGPPEPRVRREVLLEGTAGDHRDDRELRSLWHVAQWTDVHVVDVASPGRFEFVERFYDLEFLRALLPTHRPQEFLSLHALEAAVRAVNAIDASEITGAPLDAVLITGDLVDNAQTNELTRFSAVTGGGWVHPTPHGIAEGVASPQWGDPHYWHPDDVEDGYKSRWGFPSYPRILEDGAAPFLASGIQHPWFTVRGNHDALAHGTARGTKAYRELITGRAKPTAFAAGFAFDEPDELLEQFLDAPDAFLTGATRDVRADRHRRMLSRHGFLRAQLDAPGEPTGHGFDVRNVESEKAYYVRDFDHRVRLLALDSVNEAGHWDGSIDKSQLHWIEQRLIEVHSCYWAEDGRAVRTGNADRLVAIAMHHPLDTLTNLRGRGEERFDTSAFRSFLHRFPNIILVVNGHIHRHRIHAHRDATGRTGGFWEVTTASLVDWPCQGRSIEFVDRGGGVLSIMCTMIDTAAPCNVENSNGVLRLAAVHRELAANDPHAGFASSNAGEPCDRTVDLRLAAPFRLG